MSTSRLFLMMALVLGLTSARSAAAGDAPRVSDDRIPILAWQAPPADLARYREMADAGFTHCYAGASSVADALKLLDLAGEAGVKLFISCPELTSDPAATARRLAGHAALGGYFLRDEPGAGDFA